MNPFLVWNSSPGWAFVVHLLSWKIAITLDRCSVTFRWHVLKVQFFCSISSLALFSSYPFLFFVVHDAFSFSHGTFSRLVSCILSFYRIVAWPSSSLGVVSSRTVTNLFPKGILIIACFLFHEIMETVHVNRSSLQLRLDHKESN